MGAFRLKTLQLPGGGELDCAANEQKGHAHLTVQLDGLMKRGWVAGRGPSPV